ncbi:MAG: hypothetical protein ACE5NW_06155 [Acidiferrobacterales bacterium]
MIGGVRIVAVPPEFVSVSSLGAIVAEEDTSLVLSADLQLQDVKEPHDKLIKQALDTKPKMPGTVVVKGGSPLRFLAIVHDLESNPSWREEWIGRALDNIFRAAEQRELHSVAIPMLGTLHGSLDKRRFVKLLRDALEQVSLKHLQTIWLIVPAGTDREVLENLGVFDITIQDGCGEVSS